MLKRGKHGKYKAGRVYCSTGFKISHTHHLLHAISFNVLEDEVFLNQLYTLYLTQVLATLHHQTLNKFFSYNISDCRCMTWIIKIPNAIVVLIIFYILKKFLVINNLPVHLVFA